MEIPQETLEQYLPAVEEFLTSVLLEETDIEIETFDEVGNEIALEHLNNTDIYLCTREQNVGSDVIIVLDQQWFGLLSSIMLGIEEKEKNEKTIGLLEDFADDLSDVVAEQAEEYDLKFDFGDVQVFSKSEVKEELAHARYIWSKLAIEGIADDEVRAEFLMGDPDAVLEVEEEPEEVPDDEPEEDDSQGELSSVDEDDFSATISEKTESKGRKKEKVISARHIEFAEFDEENGNGHGEIHSMDLLKDVELDISVELGRIELPLGKVLELAKGSVIELEKLAGEPVDILVNNNRIALGEVVVIDEHFGVRISSLVTTKKRLAKIKDES